jgi:hypothetical protein
VRWRTRCAGRLTKTALAALAMLAAACDRTGSSGTGGSEAGGGGSRPAAEETTGSWFTEVTEEVRLRFVHDAGVDGSYFMPQIMASGCALLDYDNDGDLDAYLVSAGPRAAPRPNRLFRQESDGSFTDVTDASGLGDRGFGMGVACGDYDNDGDVDVYLTNYGPDQLYRNNGDGTFANATTEAGIRNDSWACSASWVDYDADGHLDLFVANYLHYPDGAGCSGENGELDYCGPATAPPTADVLFRNNGHGRFSDVSRASGIGRRLGRGLGVICEDFNMDGRVDIYVANDGEANLLWINNGDGTFTESAVEMGCALDRFGAGQASMGLAAGDVDNDDDPDLFMTHLARETNTFYRNLGPRGFDDQSALSGLGPPSLPFTGFGTAFFDIDHDGWPDAAVVNGRVKRGPRRPGVDPSLVVADYAETNLLFRNEGGGRFSDITGSAGAFGRHVEMSRGLAIGDVDGDGALDMLTTAAHSPARLYRNTVPQRGHWIIIRAVDPRLRRDAYGAVVTVAAGGLRQRRTIQAGFSYASSSDPRAHFGLGAATRIDTVIIRWPDGLVERFEVDGVDRAFTLRRAEGRAVRGE